METQPRMPLHDLSLDQFFTPGVGASKASRHHKRPLSPSRTPLNPAKRRVLDAEGISLSNKTVTSSPSHPVPIILSNMHTITPTRPSRLGNGFPRHYASSQGTSSPSLSQRRSPSRELYPKPTVESSTDPQSRHYPGFDIFREIEHCRGSPGRSVPLPPDDNAQSDRLEEDKENVPLKRKAKKLGSKKRFLSGLDGLDAGTFTQLNKVIRLERTPFSACQALR